jgi:hypothetical protein
MTVPPCSAIQACHASRVQRIGAHTFVSIVFAKRP